MSNALVHQPDAGGAWTPRPDRHPWLSGLEWFVDAGDRLMDALDPGDFIHIGLNHDRDRDSTARVRIETARSQDEVDDMPGIRRIERRATELAAHLPARPPFGAEIRVSADDIAVNLLWRHPGNAILLSHRQADGWRGADMIVMPARHLLVPDEFLASRDPVILQAVDRLLGGGKIAPNAYIHSASRRGDTLQLVLGAGVLHDKGP